MSHPLNENQLALLAKSAAGLAPSTIRALSELRWLEHLGLVVSDLPGRFLITGEGRARLLFEAAGPGLDP